MTSDDYKRLADRLAFSPNPVTGEGSTSVSLSMLELRLIVQALRLAAGASAGAVKGEPVAYQWRGRMRGGDLSAWSAWMPGRHPNPIYEVTETRQLYTAPPPEPVKAGRVSVPEGQTPLNDKLGHRYLDVIKGGSTARDTGIGSPYHGHSLEHVLHAVGWVQRDLRLALDKAKSAGPNGALDDIVVRLNRTIASTTDAVARNDLREIVSALSTTAPQPDNGERDGQSDGLCFCYFSCTDAPNCRRKVANQSDGGVEGHAPGLPADSSADKHLLEPSNAVDAPAKDRLTHMGAGIKPGPSDTAPAEPVAWMDEWGELSHSKPDINPQPLYLHPPRSVDVEAIARVIDPQTFAKYDAELAKDRRAENGRRWADVCHGDAINRALTKARSIARMIEGTAHDD